MGVFFSLPNRALLFKQGNISGPGLSSQSLEAARSCALGQQHSSGLGEKESCRAGGGWPVPLCYVDGGEHSH